MALSVAKPKHTSLTNPSLIHLFSSSPYQDAPSSPSQSPSEEQQQQQQQQTTHSPFFSNIIASLKQQPQNPQSQYQPNNPNFPHLRTAKNFNPSISKPSGDAASLDEIKKNLSEFRRRSFVPSPVESNAAGPPNSDQQKQPLSFSFQDLYNRHKNEKSEEGTVTTQSSPNNTNSSNASYTAFKETSRRMRQNAPPNTGWRGSFKPKLQNESGPTESTVIGGTRELPLPMFKEQVTRQDNSTDFVRIYSMDELGKKLRNLRPEVMEKGWFSLEELNERLRKLRTMHLEGVGKIGSHIQEFRASLVNIKSNDLETKKHSIQRLNLLGQLGQLDDFMRHPPKEHLVEKYFHPDNMSSAEKLKLELANVREEFKMSESDCGSARVQVALLTTKIKHLSSVLHKKDKHSRKGLNEMVQRRKKLLKYLRRTDWDSYCFVLSKLGLRDNAVMKH